MSQMLDFCVIGAQKAGTTALYSYMQASGHFCLPVNKEAPYFLGPETQDFDDFVSKFFPPRVGSQLLGSVTPQYLAYSGMAEKLHKHNPKMKIIVILRNPVQRAYSHYTMNVRRGLEDREFECVVTDQLKNYSGRSVYRGVDSIASDEKNSVVSWGAYGGLLQSYVELFSNEQILIIEYENFLTDPASVFSGVCGFLGLSDISMPKNIGQKYHVGGAATILPRADYFSRFRLLKLMWSSLPPSLRAKIKFWYETNNIKEQRNSGAESDLLRRNPELCAFYSADLARCGQLEPLSKSWF